MTVLRRMTTKRQHFDDKISIDFEITLIMEQCSRHHRNLLRMALGKLWKIYSCDSKMFSNWCVCCYSLISQLFCNQIETPVKFIWILSFGRNFIEKSLIITLFNLNSKTISFINFSSVWKQWSFHIRWKSLNSGWG